jgi:hypothetical protein
MVVQLAAHYELARQFEKAEQYYRSALERAYYPDACLGLARLETERQNPGVARSHVMAALDFGKSLGRHATPPLELLRSALTQLALLEPTVGSAQAWIATLPVGSAPAAIAGMSFVVYATNQAAAQKHFASVINGICEGGPRIEMSNIAWRMAPPEHQPFGPVRQGIQPLFEGTAGSPFRGFQRRGLWQPRHSRIQSIIDGIQLLPQCA